MVAAQFKPGTIGTITAPLQMQNIGIDGKTYQIVEARLDRVRQDNPQVGDQVEYKISSSKELTEKGKISFFAIKQRAVTSTPPAAQPRTPKSAPDVQDIQVEYVSKEQTRITLKDCVGEEQTFRADLDIIKMIAKADSPVQAGKKYKVRLSKQGEEWVVARMGSYDASEEEKPFRTGSDILKENLEQKQAETEKAQAAFAQINKENAEGDKRIKENAESLKESVKQETPIKALSTAAPPNTPTEPEKVPQNAAITVPDASLISDPLKDCPVEVKIHLDCGSYSNFDLTIPGLPTDQALAKIETDGMKFVAVLHRLMAEAKKGY